MSILKQLIPQGTVDNNQGPNSLIGLWSKSQPLHDTSNPLIAQTLPENSNYAGLRCAC